MATSAATNSQTFKMTDIPANCMEGQPPKKVEEILNLANDGTLWNSMEDFNCAKADAAGKKTKAIGDISFIVVDPNDSSIIDLGKFAVREHDPNLVFKQVLFGLQSPIGIIYALVIQVQDGVTTRDCGALIFEAFGFKKLLGWLDQTPGNGPVPVDPTDPHVIEIGKFAVDAYNQKVGYKKFAFEKVDKGTRRTTKDGMTYDLMIEAKIKIDPPYLILVTVVESTSGEKNLTHWEIVG